MHSPVATVLVVCACAVLVDAHGAMTKPNNWLDFPNFMKLNNGSWVYDYAGMKSRKHCTPGRVVVSHRIFRDESRGASTQ